MKLNWKFLGGWGMQKKKPSVGGVWIFSGTAQWEFMVSYFPCGVGFSKALNDFL